MTETATTAPTLFDPSIFTQQDQQGSFYQDVRSTIQNETEKLVRLVWYADTTAKIGAKKATEADEAVWGKPCRALFDALATQNPSMLIALVAGGRLAPSDLTFAAESLGSVEDSDAVVPVLLDLLENASSLVREGAVYGLAGHANESVMTALRRIARNDPSEGVRIAARDVVE